MNKEKIISLNSRVIQSEGNVVSDMDGEMVMLNIEKGKYYNLGELGGIIWGYLSTDVKIDTIVSSLLNIYEVDKTVCESQVLAFIKSLEKEGLVQITAEG